MRRFWKKRTKHPLAVIPQLVGPTVRPESSHPTAGILLSNDTTTTSAATRHTAVDNTGHLLTILKDGGEMLDDVPYLKAIAGILNTLFKIWEEIKEVDELVEELLGSVRRRSEKLVRSLERVGQHGKQRLKALEDDLRDYMELLESISADLRSMQEQGSIKRWLARGDSRDRIHRYLRRLTEFDGTFTVAALTEILGLMVENRHDGSLPDQPQILFQDGLPPAPKLLLGRDTELQTMRDILLNSTAPRLAILGPGGMGKTTLARQLMNNPVVLARFPTPLLVSCEHATTPTSILHTLANVLHIPPEQRGPALQTNVLKQLHNAHGTLLCLDNFEDAWDTPHTRHSIEDLLTLLDNIQTMGLILTMRGTEKPRGVAWSHPSSPPLLPIPDSAALGLFQAVSGCSDENGRIAAFVTQFSNVPLVIELLARLVEEEGFDYVLDQWIKDGIQVLDHGDDSDTRLSSVTASINLSLNSPRIYQIPYVRDVLRMLAALPDGLSESMVDALQSKLPPTLNLRRILEALKRISLCYQDSKRRYRFLAPIREHIETTIILEASMLDALRSTYLQHIIDRAHTSHYDTIAAEFGNIRLFITGPLARPAWDELQVLASLTYLGWEDRLLGIRDVALALEALSHTHSDLELQVKCRLQLSQHLRASSRAAEAETYLTPALTMVIESGGGLYWQGSVHLEMGRTQYMLEKYEEAEISLRKAVRLFRKSNDIEREADTLGRLASLFRHWGRMDQVEEPLSRSLEIAQKIGDPLNEGNALWGLGELHWQADRLSDAEDTLRLAIECFRKCHSVYGEALVLQSLGHVQRDAGTLEDAEKSYLTSRDLYSRIHDSDGEATAIHYLGQMYAQTDNRLELAERFLQEAFVIHRRNQSLDGQAFIYNDLGQLFLRQGRSYQALIYLVISVAFYVRRLHRSRWGTLIEICAQIGAL